MEVLKAAEGVDHGQATTANLASTSVPSPAHIPALPVDDVVTKVSENH